MSRITFEFEEGAPSEAVRDALEWWASSTDDGPMSRCVPRTPRHTWGTTGWVFAHDRIRNVVSVTRSGAAGPAELRLAASLLQPEHDPYRRLASRLRALADEMDDR